MDEAELLTSTDQKMDDASTANPASPSSDDSGESDSETESNHRIETLEAELSANPYIYDAYVQTTGDPTRGASVEEEPLAKRQKSNDMDAEDKSANKISTESETANSNKEESPVKLKICTDECTAFHSNLSAKAQGVSSSSLVNSELDSVEGCPSDAPMGVEIGVAGAVSSSSVGHVAVSSDSVIASMELEKNSVLQSSLDSNEVSRNTSETVCVPSLAHVTDNQDSDSSSRLSGGHGRNDKVANDSKDDDKSHLDKEKRVKRRKKRRSSRSMTVSQRLGAIDKTTADIDLGILDALEVATNIAQEVAREVDSGEASHSSSDQELSDESGESDSQHSHSDDLHTGPPSQRLSVGESHSLEEPHVGELVVMNEKNNILENGMVNSDDIKEKHLGEPAKSEVGREKSPWGFDLNEDICPEETDVVIPVSHSGIPAAGPLQLERSLSAKGLAACSVSNKVPSVDSREKKVICIDLNAAEAGDDQVEDKTPWKQFPFSSSNSRVGESSHEANLHGSSRFNLDLNCTNEDDDIPPRSELKMETRLFLSHNGQQSGSQLSSLSVAQQSGKEVNFDLNDRPQFVVDSRDQGPYYGQQPWSTASYGVQKLDEPVISLLGTKVDVDRKESVSQMASFLSNGKSLETSAGSYMGKTGKSLSLAPCVSFCPAPIYGYNGFTGPPGMSMSSAPMYVPGTSIPYMVDARGTPVMMGSAPYAQPPFPPQQHMFMSLAGGSPSLNGSVQPRFDQSYGFGVEMGNRESLSLRQFLSPGQSGAMGEHSRASVEPSSSLSIGIGGKRKEPETPRWEFPPPWR